jgi:tripartite-type tricarboxylate transporter receptor subunit TctC
MTAVLVRSRTRQALASFFLFAPSQLQTRIEAPTFIHIHIFKGCFMVTGKQYTKRKMLSSLVAAALAAGIGFGAATVQAQSFPNRPISLIVGFPPGGGSDAVARLLATALTAKLGQQVVVDNKAGANTVIATQYVRSRPADGYTLLFVSASFAINPALQKLNYDIHKDFTPVAIVGIIPLLLVTNNNVPAKSVQELVALAKTQPGKLSYATFGAGSAAHLGSEMFLAQTKTDMIHVPYKGSAPALVDVIGGQVTMMMPTIGSALTLVKDGKLRPLAVTSIKRSMAMPDIPTIAESGVPGFEVMTWESIQAPAGTPPEVVAKLNAAIREVLAVPELREQILRIGVEPDGQKSPAEASSFVKSEADKFSKLVKERNIKVE